MNKRAVYQNRIKTLCAKRTPPVTAPQLTLLMYKAGHPISVKTIHAYFQQTRQPSQKALNALCNIFGVDASAILTFS